MNVKNPKLFCSVFSNQHMKEFERIYLPAWTSLWGEPTDGWKQVSLPSRTVRVLSRPAWKQPDLQQLWEPSPAIPMGFCPLDHLVPGDWATLTSSCEVSQSLMSNWRLDMGLSHRLWRNLPGAGLPGGVSEWVQSSFREVAGSKRRFFYTASFPLSKLISSALPHHLTMLQVHDAISANSAGNPKASIFFLLPPTLSEGKPITYSGFGNLLGVEGLSNKSQGDSRFPMQEEILPRSTQPASLSLSHGFQGREKQLIILIELGNSSFIWEDLTSYKQQKLTLIPTNITIPLSIVEQGNRAMKTMKSTMNALMNIT